MKINLLNVLILWFSALFTGIMVISIGIGNEFTAVNKIMSPLICSGGKLEAAWEYNETHPGLTMYDSQWVCADDTTGAAIDASLRTNLVSGTVYGLLIIAVFLIIWMWVNRPKMNSG